LYRQEAATRKKRRDRDALLRSQAEAASHKRKLTDPQTSGNSTKDDTPQPSKTSESTATLTKDSILSTKTRVDRTQLPEFLPAEFLEEDEDVDMDDIIPSRSLQVKPKKIKFSDIVEKKPKDRTVGSTTFRVAENGENRHLAPKAAKNARSTKEAWLAGRSGKGGAGGDNRRAVGGGFFKNGGMKR
jgi:U3 small nucleolar RNA-associated protein 16